MINQVFCRDFVRVNFTHRNFHAVLYRLGVVMLPSNIVCKIFFCSKCSLSRCFLIYFFLYIVSIVYKQQPGGHTNICSVGFKTEARNVESQSLSHCTKRAINVLIEHKYWSPQFHTNTSLKCCLSIDHH